MRTSTRLTPTPTTPSPMSIIPPMGMAAPVTRASFEFEPNRADFKVKAVTVTAAARLERSAAATKCRHRVFLGWSRENLTRLLEGGRVRRQRGWLRRRRERVGTHIEHDTQGYYCERHGRRRACLRAGSTAICSHYAEASRTCSTHVNSSAYTFYFFDYFNIRFVN